MKLKNECLKDLIGGAFGTSAPKLYAIIANHINQAILGFTTTTERLQKDHELGRLTIPDILDMQGQVARCYAESCFQKKISNDLDRLRSLSEPELLAELKALKLNLRDGFINTGMGDLEQQILCVDEAK